MSRAVKVSVQIKRKAESPSLRPGEVHVEAEVVCQSSVVERECQRPGGSALDLSLS